MTADADDAFRAGPGLAVLWRGEPVARLVAGPDPLRPGIELLAADALDADQGLRIRRRLERWLAAWLGAGVGPLQVLAAAPLSGAARGIAYQIVEGLGVALGEGCLRLARELDDEGRKALARLGVRLGFYGAYLKPLMSSRDLDLRALLWAAAAGVAQVPLVPARGEVAIDADDALPDDFYHAIGYRRLGARALRIDMTERLAAEARGLTRKAPAEAPAEPSPCRAPRARALPA